MQTVVRLRNRIATFRPVFELSLAPPDRCEDRSVLVRRDGISVAIRLYSGALDGAHRAVASDGSEELHIRSEMVVSHVLVLFRELGHQAVRKDVIHCHTQLFIRTHQLMQVSM